MDQRLQEIQHSAGSLEEIDQAVALVTEFLECHASLGAAEDSDCEVLSPLPQVAAREIASTPEQLSSGFQKDILEAVETASARREINAFTWLAKHSELIPNASIKGSRDRVFPVAVKDNISVQSWPHRAGSAARDQVVATTTAPAIRKLEAAGAVVIGLTNMDEFAFGGSTDNVVHGATKNPVDYERGVGGSSGGSAAAVAAGIVPVAIGTDTGGSVRLPAAMTGTVGFRPSTGLIDLEGVVPLARSFDTIGPIANNVHDARIVTEIMSGCSLQSADRSIQRLAVIPELFPFGLEAPVQKVWGDFCSTMRQLDVEVIEVGFDDLQDYFSTWFLIHLIEAYQEHEEVLKTTGDRLGPKARVPFLAGGMLPEKLLGEAQKIRANFNDRIYELMDNVDAVISPTLAFQAQPVQASTVSLPAGEIPLFTANPTGTWLASMAGLPAISIPMATTDLPVGLHIMGQRGHDARILDIAEAIERAIKEEG